MAKIEKIPCVWIFKSEECGYKGTEDSCDQTFEDCKKKGNEARFGGGLSLPQGGNPYKPPEDKSDGQDKA